MTQIVVEGVPTDDAYEIIEKKYLRDEEDFQPWVKHSLAFVMEQKTFREVLKRRAGGTFLAETAIISTRAHIFTHHLKVGENSWIAGGATVRGYIEIGANCTVNPFAHIAGKVIIGNGVRIAGLASIYGFNHGHNRIDIPIFEQPHTSLGIVIGEGTWVGANSVIIDGVTIGAHCIIAAGAVVTRNVEDYTIVGGNPAKIIARRQNRSDLKVKERG